eukprot:6234138-Lingulodinium_polyedra.AAC.2
MPDKREAHLWTHALVFKFRAACTQWLPSHGPKSTTDSNLHRGFPPWLQAGALDTRRCFHTAWQVDSSASLQVARQILAGRTARSGG